ncbi:hypothetical protein FJY68_05320 [candidate division WOR-3 bacterium]|uniref:Uncharacterized protein n=1 Tax=candidate division WOR-3 bacterium TaxID=2052148 RepID=A0A938BR41_UNCW3|nr:hypothetical protein [candidate division WOR-3 bacterium]
MKVEGMDWMDWLHKVREESEKERIRRGIGGAEWLKQIRARAEAFKRERAGRDTPAVHDRKPGS